ncbi:MAG: DNA glycosylase AlkZ-like family protein [Propionibacteriaceae bacterium]
MGSESAAGVVRRLGAVLSLEESLAELAVRTRSVTSGPGELGGNPRWRGIPDLDEAGSRAITAYFQTYGPATLDHLYYWLGNGLSAGRKRLRTWFAELGDRLAEVDVEGTTSYVLREDVESLAATRPSEAVRFLPGHDQWVIGPGTKDVHVVPSSRRALMTRKANPVILGGVVCGCWLRKATRSWSPGSTSNHSPGRRSREEPTALGGILGRDLTLSVSSGRSVVAEGATVHRRDVAGRRYGSISP